MTCGELYSDKRIEHDYLAGIALSITESCCAVGILLIYYKAVNSLAVHLNLPARLVGNARHEYLTLLSVYIAHKVTVVGLLCIENPLILLELVDVLCESFFIKIVEIESALFSYHEVLVASRVGVAVRGLDSKSYLDFSTCLKRAHSYDRR